MDAAELLLHPVRLRIVHALSSVPGLTTTDLSERMPGVSRVTVYRQVALLLDGGFVEVAGEQRVRGAVERRYRLHHARPVVDVAAAGEMTSEDHRRGFATAIAVLIAEFNAYLDRDDANPVADQVSYVQRILWLSHDELVEMSQRMLDVLRDSVANGPAPGRAPYLLSPILFPTASPLTTDSNPAGFPPSRAKHHF